jgi:hypothetical protein
MNKTNFADLNDFSDFHCLYFSVGPVLMLANSFEKKKKLWKFPQDGKLRASTVLFSTHLNLEILDEWGRSSFLFLFVVFTTRERKSSTVMPQKRFVQIYGYSIVKNFELQLWQNLRLLVWHVSANHVPIDYRLGFVSDHKNFPCPRLHCTYVGMIIVFRSSTLIFKKKGDRLTLCSRNVSTVSRNGGTSKIDATSLLQAFW